MPQKALKTGLKFSNWENIFVKIKNINNLRLHIDVAFMPFDDLA